MERARAWTADAAARVPALGNLEGGTASLAALFAPILAIAALGWLLRWVSDDGWINIRILQQLFAGNGFVFNSGERVEAGTSTLWLALVAGLHLLAPGADLGLVSVVLGVVLTTLAITLATLAGVRVARRSASDLVGFLPFGTAAVVALPPFWDFATSGLETSLTFCWLALCYWLLVRRVPAQGEPATAAWWPVWPAFVIGLGWLVRPDAALYAVAFAVALLVQSRFGLLGWLGAFVAAVLVPAAYQVFRMGYFAALVPNTALAKDAGASKLQQGLYYLRDFAVPYSVWFPLLLGAALIAGPAVGWARARDWRLLVTVVCPVVPAVLHAAYVVRVGGDFMHARFLLPPVFALLLPVAVIGVRPGQQLRTVAAALGLGWAMAVGSGARVAYTDTIDVMTDEYAGTPNQLGVANERAFWHSRTLAHRSVLITDWRGSASTRDAEDVAWDRALGRSYYRDDRLLGYLFGRATYDERARLDQEARRRRADPQHRPVGILFDAVDRRTYLVADNMGIQAVTAGVDVHLVDRHALTDAVTSRAKPEHPQVARMGHRPTDPAWQAARFVDNDRLTNRHITNAAAALKCGDLPVLLEAVTAPMTRERFMENLRLAPRLTAFTFPEDPTRAREVLCGYAPPVVPR
ncbi:flagellar motor control protein ZomB [Mariniluteicoccus flavus]